MQSTKMQNAKLGNVENNDVTASSSGFIDAFPLPFQEVSGDEYGTHTQSHDIDAPQESWRSWSLRNLAYPTKPTGRGCWLNHHHHDTPPKEKGNTNRVLSCALPPPLPLQRKPSASSECHHEGDSDSQQKMQLAGSTSSSHRGSNGSTIPPSGNVLLPEDFTPRKWSVLVGRDKKSVKAPGTKRLHIIIRWYLERYAKSRKDKEAKSSIISEIESTVRSACQDGVGAFIKYSNGRWWEIDVAHVREKISRMIREALYTKYSSSSKQKRARRRCLLQTESSNEVEEATSVSTS